MKPIIINKLKKIEDKYNVKILFAVESGSRAWGFPSTDSDYDVRFIYKRKIEYYLKIDPIDDFIDLEIVDELDFKGWDIQKVLRLMLKSNSSINEYLQSPIHYISDEIFEKELFDLAASQFNSQKVVMHYLGITTKRMVEMELQNEIKLKSLFYALRSILSAKWIVENKTIPPMEFEKLKYLIGDRTIENRVDNYLEIKEKVDEGFRISKNDELFNWLINLKTELKIEAEKLSRIEFDQNKINVFFIKTITK
ncbi:nucleotidyltransferase domain-containing protein [Empedobacter falsenii]|uniref:nucleotidyltransferase domain-containing protein n=1 Tax=Empedobacter falsenii TaxID=343874 RepID=UPI002576A8C2|nr:nucleotidyltransferase domain-containing protein [Empedobacter falsenii]MDM1063208.1 nucleotidyltransferase domain-containing protein [Empedobacter falsenii]